jgi:hypothetical protein
MNKNIERKLGNDGEEEAHYWRLQQPPKLRKGEGRTWSGEGGAEDGRQSEFYLDWSRKCAAMGEKKEREMREGDRMERIEMWKNGGIFRLDEDEGNEGRIRRKKFQMVKGEGEIGHLKSSL